MTQITSAGIPDSDSFINPEAQPGVFEDFSASEIA